MKDQELIKILIMGFDYIIHDKISNRIIQMIVEEFEVDYNHAINLPVSVTFSQNVTGQNVKIMIHDPGVMKSQTYPKVDSILFYFKTSLEVNWQKLYDRINEYRQFNENKHPHIGLLVIDTDESTPKISNQITSRKRQLQNLIKSDIPLYEVPNDNIENFIEHLDDYLVSINSSFHNKIT